MKLKYMTEEKRAKPNKKFQPHLNLNKCKMIIVFSPC